MSDHEKRVVVLVSLWGGDYAALSARNAIGEDELLRRAAGHEPLIDSDDELRSDSEIEASCSRYEFGTEKDAGAALGMLREALDVAQDYDDSKHRGVLCGLFTPAEAPEGEPLADDADSQSGDCGPGSAEYRLAIEIDGAEDSAETLGFRAATDERARIRARALFADSQNDYDSYLGTGASKPWRETSTEERVRLCSARLPKRALAWYYAHVRVDSGPPSKKGVAVLTWGEDGRGHTISYGLVRGILRRN